MTRTRMSGQHTAIGRSRLPDEVRLQRTSVYLFNECRMKESAMLHDGARSFAK